MVETDRLFLREMTVDDLDSLYDIYESWGIPEGVEQLSPDKNEEREKLSGYIKYMYGFYGIGLWAVCLKENGRMIGRCGAWPSEISGDWILELGYIIHKEQCRSGYGFEAMKGVIDYIRYETDFDKAAAKIHKDNKISVHLAQRLGMILDKDAFDEEGQICLYRIDIS